MIDREAVRRELDATRGAYHELLASITEDSWQRKSGNPDMTVKQLMWHVAWATAWMAGSIDAVREGKSIGAPAFLLEPGRKLAMWWLARGATPEAAGRKYDEGHAVLIEKLDTVPEEEWSRTAMRFGQERSVEWYFRHPPEHFVEHAADVRSAIAERPG